MRDINEFDNFLKDSFKDYSPEVPTHIWESIAKEKEKRRVIPFWFNNKRMLLSLAAVLLSFCVAGILYINNKQKTSSNTSIISSTSTPTVSNNYNGDNQNNKANKSSNKSIQKIDNANETDITQKALNTNNEVNDFSAINNLPLQHSKSHTTKSLRTNKIFTADNSSKNIFNKDEISYDTKNKKPLNKSTSSINTNTNNGIIETITADATEEENEIASNSLSEPIAGLALHLKPQLQLNNLQFASLKIPDCPTLGTNKSYLEIYSGPDYSFKKYSDTGISAMTSKRKQIMSNQLGYSLGLRYTKVFNNNMSIRLGVNYSEIREKFSFLKDNVVQMVYVINANGDTTERYNIRGTRYQNSYNYYRSIDVPITIGYELGNDKWHANINTGVIANIYSWQNGSSIDNNFNPINITTGKADNQYQYKTNIGLAFTAAASVYYKLNNKFHLLAEPYLRYHFSPINKEASLLQEKFTTIGIRLGIRLDLH